MNILGINFGHPDAAAILLKEGEWLAGSEEERFKRVKHWAGLRTPEAVRKAADLLADYGWLAREAIPTGAAGGRPTERYLIHPMLLNGVGA